MTQASYRSSLIICVLFCLAVGLIMAFSLHYSYKQTLKNAERSLLHSSDLVAEWIVGAFAASDYLLLDLVGHIDPKQLLYPHPDPEAHRQLTALLVEKQSTITHVLIVGAMNADCILTHGNMLIGFDGSEREYCQALRDNPQQEMIVTHGYVNAINQFSVAQARRLVSEDQNFAGLVVIGMDLKFFDRWLDRIEIEDGASIAVLDHQGLLLARKPWQNGVVGKRFVHDSVQSFLDSNQITGLFYLPSPVDGANRLFVARRVADLPFIVVIGLSEKTYLQPWRIQLVISSGALLMLWMLAILTLRKHWQVLRQGIQFAQLARHDALTQVPNRRYFLELAERERLKAERQQSALSLLLLDVDHFKEINDNHGHPVGDRALVTFKDTCQQALRTVDLFGRWGGDEFVVLLPDDATTAQVVAERVRTAVMEAVVFNDKQQQLALSTSIGFASTVAGAPLPSLDTLFRYADQALYQVKQMGRNQVQGVVVSSAPPHQ